MPNKDGSHIFVENPYGVPTAELSLLYSKCFLCGEAVERHNGLVVAGTVRKIRDRLDQMGLSLGDPDLTVKKTDDNF